MNSIFYKITAAVLLMGAPLLCFAQQTAGSNTKAPKNIDSIGKNSDSTEKNPFGNAESSFENAKNLFGNALVPDMTADASIQEIDGTFYCSATTDGMGHGLQTSGPPVLWKSKDFVHWHFDGLMYADTMKMKYWAPSKMVKANGQWYSYPTLNGRMHVAVSQSPDGTFVLAKQGQLIPGDGGIDAEIFIDDDGKKYIFWNRRNAARLCDDMVTVDMTTHITISSPHNVYSEGPCFFKRNGIYYYLYTLGGDERYQYAYMMSRTSPLGPYEIPKDDIITTTNYATGTFGPGHGCVFRREKSDDYYIAFLEFGRNSTNRQTYVNRLEFNADGTIRPVQVNMEGVGALRKVNYGTPLAIADVNASSTLQPQAIRYFKDEKCQRTEHFVPQFAIDGANGSRWMADAANDAQPSFTLDLGRVQKVKRCEVAFVRPTEGHAYRIETSLDGQSWTTAAEKTQREICSPHIDRIGKKVRFVRITILEGVQGIWECQLY